MNSVFDIASSEFSAQEVSDYFRYLSKEMSIDKLKLQKLLYYAQGLYLAAHKKPLFAQKIKNWEHGPVVPEVYFSSLKESQGNTLLPIVDEPNNIPETVKMFLMVINESFNSHSGWSLRELTHAEAPWKETQDKEEITLEALFDHFEDHVILDSTNVPVFAVPETRHVIHKGRKYVYKYIPDLQDGGYVASVLDLPGCMTEGESLMNLHENVQEAIEDWLSAR